MIKIMSLIFAFLSHVVRNPNGGLCSTVDVLRAPYNDDDLRKPKIKHLLYNSVFPALRTIETSQEFV